MNLGWKSKVFLGFYRGLEQTGLGMEGEDGAGEEFPGSHEFLKFCQGTFGFLHSLLPKNSPGMGEGGDFQQGITPSFQLELGNSVCRKNNPNQAFGFFFFFSLSVREQS